MKTKLFLLMVIGAMAIGTAPMMAQSADNEDEVIKIDKWNQNAYREGEILVKFKADGAVQMKAPRKAKFATSQVNSIDALFAELGVDSVEQLMPMTGHKNVGRRVRAYNGSEVEVKDLSKLYRLTLKAEKAQDIHTAIDRLKAMGEVEFAEPNYIVYTMSLPYDADIPTADQATYTAEPLYSQQWGIPAINLPALWDKPKKSSKRPVIAILDTGVDIEHPDLAANIWTNTAEANGIAKQDDDANGFKDDIHGWDFINQTGVIKDFNGHGTHCAGIAAAVGNNGIGITGANPDAYIMPVTVMQSNGSGDVATIVKGIDYAAANGADVISMSIGHYSYSIAEEQALGSAYASAIVVAAAGNDGCCFEGCLFCPSLPMFPAGFTFVLGVEASSNVDGDRASYSNYDATGPIYSTFSEEQLYNYELRAPGSNILSTFPNGRYKKLNGTSMACPLVAGAISRLIQCKEIQNQELLFGDMIHTRQNEKAGNVDILAIYNIADADRHPELAVISTNLTDTAYGDGDMRADAGETIEFYPILKNAWGQAENIRYWMKTGFYNSGDWVWDDITLVQHLQDTAYFGKPLSSYSKATALNPYRIMISPDCPDGREINMTLFVTCDNVTDTLKQSLTLSIENGVEIGGMIAEDLTLYPNVHYIVTNNLAVPNGVKLTIKPGVVLKFKNNVGISLTSNCSLEAIGTPDSMIVFSTIDNTPGNVNFNGKEVHYAIFENMNIRGAKILMNNCIVRNSSIDRESASAGSNRVHSFDNINNFSPVSTADPYPSIQNSNYINCENQGNGSTDPQYYTLWRGNGWKVAQNCNAFNNYSSKHGTYITLASSVTIPTVYHSDLPSYLGSAREDIVRQSVMDIENGWQFGYFDLSNMLTRPSAEAHGIVWKILVDGIDAQDEFELLPPIGVGQHRCDVYFNRPMDVSVTPTVSFGVRSPYTQNQVAENSSWSADSTIYTAYFTINGKSVTDGLNTFYVRGAEDNEHFATPEEKVRFHMEVAAAGSMSTGLMAEAGLGKITLTWETDEEDFADLLGYNIYRWTTDTIKWNRYYDSSCKCYIEAGWRIDTVCINSTLIDAADTEYIDYDVIPGKAYYYVIRQMTTSMSSYDLSNPVTATPLTAIKGDANGSMSVDVADVITEVNYITHQNPQPFIFEAADVNSDNEVNIIDVVATIDIILHPQANMEAIQEATAYYYIENGILYVESDAVLGGIQCTFEAENGYTFTTLDALNGFETVGTWQSEEQYLFMAYSMSGKTIGVGKNALLQIGDAELTSIILSDAQGHNVPAAPRISMSLDGTTFIPAASKYLQEGNLFIKHGEHIYNVMGTLIK